MTTLPPIANNADIRFLGAQLGDVIRRYGGDCYIYAMVASGFADLAVETGLQTYDYMALVPVVEQAGGIITDWSGKRPDFGSDGTIVAAATQELHQQALEILNS